MRGWAPPVFFGLLGCGAVATPEPRPELLGLKLTEIHYHPLDEGTVSGDEYEFIELKNTGDSVLKLTDVAITQGIQYAIPANTTLEPGAFMVVASNAAAFHDRYGFAASGSYTGKLQNTRERISLTDLPAHALITSVEYLDKSPWPADADGVGRSLVPVATDLGDDPGRPAHWRTSFAIHGSPGKDDPAVAYINEVMSHTDRPLRDAIELFNPNNFPLDVSGWFLTDRIGEPMRYRIPAGTILPARGFGVFDEDDFSVDPTIPGTLSLSEHGEQVYLVADSTGCAAGFCDGLTYSDMENGATFGRHVTSMGEVHLVTLRTPTLGSENAGPAVGPLVISEIMYNPPTGLDEYIELQNTGMVELPLSEPSVADHTWKIEGIGFAFPPSTTLAAGETILVISSSVPEAAFREKYGVPHDVRLFSMPEDLADYGDVLTVMKSWKPYNLGLQVVSPFIVQETIAFGSTAPWPTEANGLGSALHRKDQNEYGNDPANWEARAPTPGRVP